MAFGITAPTYYPLGYYSLALGDHSNLQDIQPYRYLLNGTRKIMHHIIVSDIFGRTQALEKFASAFSENVEIFDPYNSEMMGFKNEADVYKHLERERKNTTDHW
ncbi:MAG: hypothetical protein GY710_05720 [Desulfobacteraceae bacterium]|nr:hypothetical protein [Desulfobacteraceae bacterium]